MGTASYAALPLAPPLQPTGCFHRKLPWSPLALVQDGGGEEDGLTTGAKADFCLTAADTMLAGEKEKTPEEEEQLEGREVEEAIVGLDGTTAVMGCHWRRRWGRGGGLKTG